MDVSTTGGPGRPRSEDADKAILVAAIDMLHEVGYQGLSMERVAARAKVAKTTVYRRYPSKVELAVAAATQERDRGVPVPDTGDTRQDVAIWLRMAAAFQTQTNWNRVIAGIAAETRWTPEMEAARRAFWQQRVDDLCAIFQRGKGRGDLRDDVDPEFVVELALGPLYFRTLVSGAPLTPEYVEMLVEEVMRYATR